jgi:hypothetical protein
MIKLEKDMKPIVSKLMEYFETDIVVEELRAGIGIADMVFVKKNSNNTNDILFDNYLDAYYYVKYIENVSSFTKKDLIKLRKKSIEIERFIKKLVKLGYIEENNGEYIIRKKYTPSSSNIISIELKLKDWKGAVNQAIRYKEYSYQSYVALLEEYVKNVDLELFKEYNIGLISVNDESAKVILEPKLKKPKLKEASYYLSDSIIREKTIS